MPNPKSMPDGHLAVSVCNSFRRLMPDLVKNHMEGPKGFRAMLAPWVHAGFVEIVEGEIRFWNGAQIYLCHCKEERDRYKYQSGPNGGAKLGGD